jgi:hypothetical protein
MNYDTWKALGPFTIKILFKKPLNSPQNKLTTGKYMQQSQRVNKQTS